MTREEQIKKEALKECSSFDLPDKEGKFKGVNSAYGLGFCEGAKWADKTMIDKACDWLKTHIEEYYTYDVWKGDCIDVDVLINDLKTAIEE